MAIERHIGITSNPNTISTAWFLISFAILSHLSKNTLHFNARDELDSSLTIFSI